MKSSTNGTALMEAAKIAKSLSVFGNVISAFYGDLKPNQQKRFVPYRDSKITMILMNALESKNCAMFLCLNPSSTCYDESMCCLRFVSRIIEGREKRRVEEETTGANESRI